MNYSFGSLERKFVRSVTAVSVLTVLTACGSDSKSNPSPQPETKTVTLRLIPNVASTPVNEALVAENGYEHFIELQQYQVTVDGELVAEDVLLDLEVPAELKLEVSNLDEVQIAVTHTRLEGDREVGAVNTAILDGQVTLAQESTEADIVLDNNHYSYVTVDLNENLFVNQARLNGEVLTRHDGEAISDSFKYGYTQQENSTLAIESDMGVAVALFSSNQAKQYKMAINEHTNELILDDEEDEIDLGGPVAINPNYIKYAENVTVSETGAVQGSSFGEVGKPTTIVYPMKTLSGFTRDVQPLNRYEFDLDITVDDPTAKPFVNIYLLKDDVRCRADYEFGKVYVNNCENNGYQTFDSYEKFLQEYGDWGVRNDYYEIRFGLDPVNFVYRLGDSTYANAAQFSVNAHDISLAPSVIKYDQVVGAKDLTTGAAGSVSGLTDGKAPFIFVPVDEELALSNYDLSIDIDFEGAQHFVNIYLLNEAGEKVRATYFLSGASAGTVEIESQHLPLDEFMETYADYTVRNYLERNGLRIYQGNFFWRGGDSRYTGSDDVFTVREYQVK